MLREDLGSLPPSVTSLQQCIKGILLVTARVGWVTSGSKPAYTVPKITWADRDLEVRAGLWNLTVLV